jgi:hypothetical protein
MSKENRNEQVRKSGKSVATKTPRGSKRTIEAQVSGLAYPLDFHQNEAEFFRIAAAVFSHNFSRLEGSLEGRLKGKPLYEFKRFLILKAVHKDTTASVLSPSKIVDEVWHQFLLFPLDYYSLCDMVLPADSLVRLIDHCPEGALQGPERIGRYYRTLEAYRDFFKEEPPEDVWPFGRTSTAALSDQRKKVRSGGSDDDPFLNSGANEPKIGSDIITILIRSDEKSEPMHFKVCDIHIGRVCCRRNFTCLNLHFD